LKRDLGVLVGVAAILATVVVININWGRGDLIARMDNLRRMVESKRESRGLPLMKWELIRQTKGSVMTAPTYPDDLKAMDGQRVDIVGFTVALNQYRNMTEFMLLPLPLECYFCQIPPMKDQMLVVMAEGETTNLYKDPVLINGRFRLRKDDKEKFFYFLEDARVGPGDPDKSLEDLERQYMKQEHMQPQHENTGDLLPPSTLFSEDE
jgi:hypothetical protein